MRGGGEVNDAGAAPAPAGAGEGQEQEIIVAQINTYAKGKQVTYDVVILKNGRVVNMNAMVPEGPMEAKKLVDLGEVVAELVIRNSWNNRHAHMKLPISAIMAMVEVEDKDTIKYNLKYGNGQLVEEVEKDRDNNYVYIRKVLYLVTNDNKYRITTLTQQSTPIVRIKRQGSSVIVNGNTFPVKEKLKSIGARWDPEAKVWILPAHRVESLRQFAVVEEVI